MNSSLIEKLHKSIWIGGSPCSGKSTCADCLSKEYGFSVYRCDDYMYKHVEKSDQFENPTMHKYKSLKWNEIWMRQVNDQVIDEINFYYEEFEMILRDIADMEYSNGIVIEGAAVLPDLIRTIGVEENRVLYLLPTKEFQYDKYSKREFIKDILKECISPAEAFKNWMERDQGVSKYIKQKALDNRYKFMVIDGKKDIDSIYQEVKTHFQETITELISKYH
jgi:2-phosphoglycerate kinase